MRSRCGYVGHSTGAYADLTCAQNATLRARWLGMANDVATARIVALVEALSLRAIWQRPVRDLSRGQKQRLALVLSLLQEPELILWDEPTTGLDTDSVARMLSQLAREHKRGATLLVVTHDADFRARMIERIPCRRFEMTDGVLSEHEGAPIQQSATTSRQPFRSPSWLSQMGETFLNDIRIELKTRETTGASLAFGFIVFVLASLAFHVDAISGKVLASGALWVSLALVGSVAIARVWNREREEGALLGVLQSGVPLSAFYWGKTLSTLMDLSVVSLPFAGLSVLFFRVDAAVFVEPALIALWTLGLFGFAMVGTLFGAMTVRTRARDALLSIVLLPLLLPILLTCASASRALFVDPQAHVWAWVRVVLAYDLLVGVMATFFFGPLVDSE